jgi:hypothetical protein
MGKREKSRKKEREPWSYVKIFYLTDFLKKNVTGALARGGGSVEPLRRASSSSLFRATEATIGKHWS